jgi:hypothetical protein
LCVSDASFIITEREYKFMDNSLTGLIAALSARIGRSLEVMDGTKVHVDFDDFALLIEYFPQAGQLLLASAVAEVPKRGRAGLYKTLLQGHFLFGRTGGAALALDPAEKFICLQITLPITSLTSDSFPGLVENFLNQAGEWRQRCLEAGREEMEDLAETATESFVPGPGLLRI